MLRLPDGMRERIKAAADQNNRSMNSEIVATLAEKYPGIDEWDQRIAQLILVIAEDMRRVSKSDYGYSEQGIISALQKAGFAEPEVAAMVSQIRRELDRK